VKSNAYLARGGLYVLKNPDWRIASTSSICLARTTSGDASGSSMSGASTTNLCRVEAVDIADTTSRARSLEDRSFETATRFKK